MRLPSAIFALCLFAASARAATVSWIAPVDGSWFDPARWSGGAVPGPNDDVVIDVEGTYTIDTPEGIRDPYPIRSLTLGGASGAQTLSLKVPIDLAAASSIGEHGRLVLYQAHVTGTQTLTNRGLIDCTRFGIAVPLDHYGTLLYRDAGSSQLDGSKVVSRPGSLIQVGVLGTPDVARLAITGSFVNHGLIRVWAAASPSNLSLAVNGPDGVIDVASSFPGTIGIGVTDNQGRIEIRTPVQLGLAGNEGWIELQAPAKLGISAALSCAGTIDIQPNLELGIFGASTNSKLTFLSNVMGGGQVRLRTLHALDLVTPAGAPPVVLGGDVTADHARNKGTLFVQGERNTITNLETDPGSTIRVLDSGVVGPSQLTVRNNAVNHGAIEIDPPTVSGYSKFLMLIGGLTNASDGTIRGRAGAGGDRLVQGRIENFGTLVADGSLELRGGPVNHHEGAVATGDGILTVSGGGYVDGGGTSPGLATGRLSIVGDDVRGPTSTLDVDVAGPAAQTEYDVLDVSGAFECGGALRLHLLGGYQPQLGDVFTIVNAAAVSGVFADVEGAFLPGGLAFRVDYLPQQVQLHVVEASTPVLLISFDGAATEEGVALRWQLGDPSMTVLAVERAAASDGPWTRTAATIDAEGSAIDRDVPPAAILWYRLVARRGDGTSVTLGPIQVATGGAPLAFALAPVSPNPALGAPSFRLGIPRTSKVRLTVHDVRGRLVAVPFAGTLDAGWREVSWRGDAAPGVYVATLEAAGRRFTRRFTVLF